MEIEKNYSHATSEQKWYKEWISKKYFESKPDGRKPFTIVIPPPNVTGVLHVGHVLNNTIQDTFIRRARMQGFNACWVPGTDHASIATEAKVVAMLKEKGIDKKSIGRDEFLKYAFQWKEKYGDIIIEQLKKMGASCDWNRVSFTMDDDYYKAVIKVFVDLYNKGFIYRGTKMVNWDPSAQTALSDEEVYFKEVESKIYTLKYQLVDEEGYISVATTRPETILGDTAVCVHPDDKRYHSLIGKLVTVPLLGRKIPIIADEYVDIEFGTGALKITPAHDKNDYELGKKHNLESIEIFDSEAKINFDFQDFYGIERFEARKKIVLLLDESSFLLKTESHTNNIGCSERTHSVIEPRISNQWFCKMDEMAEKALEVVLDGSIQFIPQKFVNTYKSWMENIREWCVSRQLWWGQQIPVFYLTDGSYVVAPNKEEALDLAKAKTGNNSLVMSDLEQENDVLDTWFSSWLWPMEVFKGVSNPNNDDINYYYPTQVLVTGPDIIFFWVARMVMAGLEYKNQIPFEKVYFTGIVRDELGRKYSKQLGNSPDIFKIIEDYGADALRFGILISAPAGNDIPFSPSTCEQGRNFINKFWNALKLIQLWIDKEKIKIEYSDDNEVVVDWFENKLAQKTAEIDKHFEDHNLQEVLTSIYSLIWDDFCSKYLEYIKPPMEGFISEKTFQKTVHFFEAMMKLLHPIMPFITEEVWRLLKTRTENESICISEFPKISNFDVILLRNSEKVMEMISKIRAYKIDNGTSFKDLIDISIKSDESKIYLDWHGKIKKMAGVSEIQIVKTAPEKAVKILIDSDELFLPISENFNAEEERERISKELDYFQGFLKSVEAKLSNEKFVQNAKAELIEKEKQKQEDAISKIAILKQNLIDFNS